MGAAFSSVLPHLGAGGATFTRFAGFACLTLQGNNGVLMERKQHSKRGGISALSCLCSAPLLWGDSRRHRVSQVVPEVPGDPSDPKRDRETAVR